VHCSVDVYDEFPTKSEIIWAIITLHAVAVAVAVQSQIPSPSDKIYMNFKISNLIISILYPRCKDSIGKARFG
jgi:hypothetical protein